MTTKSREQKLDELIAKQEITEVLVRCTYGADRCDEALLASVYTENGIDHHSSFSGPAREFAKWATDFHKTVEHTQHIITNILIEVDGDGAMAQTYVLAFVRMRREAPYFDTNLDGSIFDGLFGGRYLDRLEREGDEWKLAERTYLHDWARADTVENLNVSTPASTFVAAARNREDPSYAYLRSIHVGI